MAVVGKIPKKKVALAPRENLNNNPKIGDFLINKIMIVFSGTRQRPQLPVLPIKPKTIKKEDK